MTRRLRPWFPSAANIARSIERDRERDDEFGSIAEWKRDARHATKAHGHALGKFSFKGSLRWVTHCTRCVKLVIVDETGINFFGKRDCLPCGGHVGSLNAAMGSAEFSPVPA